MYCIGKIWEGEILNTMSDTADISQIQVYALNSWQNGVMYLFFATKNKVQVNRPAIFTPSSSATTMTIISSFDPCTEKRHSEEAVITVMVIVPSPAEWFWLKTPDFEKDRCKRMQSHNQTKLMNSI